MNYARIVGIIAASLLAAGCANYQQLRAQRLDEMTANVEKNAAAWDDIAVGNTVHELLRERPAEVKALLARSQVARSKYLTYLQRQAALREGQWPPAAESIRADIEATRNAGALSPTELAGVQAVLDRAVADANRSGSIAFDLTNSAQFDALRTPEHRRILLDRTFAGMSDASRRKTLVESVLHMVKTTPLEPQERSTIAARLAKADLRRSDLEAVEAVFPELGAQLRQRLLVKAAFRIKGADRLVEEDLKKAFATKFQGLELAGDGAPVQITVEKIRQDERTIPESRDTVTYAQHQVDIAYAVLLMPRNASYLYDISRSGASIDYGYVVMVESPGLPKFEKLVRGTASGEQVRCSNQRVQNVFGGVQGADWVANSDMASRCRSGNGKSLNDLREDILREVADAAADAPQLRSLTGE